MTMILFNEIIEIFRCTMTSGFEFKVFNQFRQCDRQLPRRTGDEDHILMIPISLVKKKSIISHRKETMVSDREKRVMLKDKIIYKMDTIHHLGNRIINYLAYFIPSRNAWETLNKQYNLIPSNISE